MNELKQLLTTDFRIESAHEEIKQLAMLESSNATPEFMQGEIELRIKELEEEINQAFLLKLTVSKKIQSLKDDRQTAVLRYRYISGLLWQEIAELLEISETQVQRIHKLAVEEYEKLNI